MTPTVSVATIGDGALESAWLRADAEALDPGGPCPREVIGLRASIIRCGVLPDVATVDVMSAAVDDSARELRRIEMVWLRLSCRRHVPGIGIEHAPARLQVRHRVVRDICQWRAEAFRKLVRDPIAGST
jgi:hypothetical protein